MTAEQLIKVANDMGYADEKQTRYYIDRYPKEDYDEWQDIRDLYRMWEPPYRCVKRSQAHKNFVEVGK